MATEKKILKISHPLSDESKVIVEYGVGVPYPGEVRLIVDGRCRSDLIKSVRPVKADPENFVEIELTEAVTGYLQVLGLDSVRIGQATAEEAATSMMFGRNKTYARNDTMKITASGTEWVDMISMPVDIAEEDDYRIGTCYAWQTSSSGAGKFFHGRVIIDDGTTETEVRVHRERAKQLDSDTVATFFDHVTLAPGSYTIKLQFKRDGGQLEARMSKANMEFWR